MRVARRGPPGGWRNPPRGTSTGCGHSRNQRWACWHSSPTSAGCEVAKKWSLARISVYRMLLSAIEGTPVKGRGFAFPGQALPLLPIILSCLSSRHICPWWFPAFGPLPGTFSSPPLSHADHLILISAQRSLLKKSILQSNPPVRTVPVPRSYHSCNLAFLCVFILGPSHPHYPRTGVSWKQE